MGASWVDGGLVVGRVAGLWRYPVKSMAPESLQQVDVSWHGVGGDRRWAFMRDGRVRSGMPWLTIPQQSNMVRYRPSFSVPDRPEWSPTMVTTPSGDTYEVTDPALASELGGEARAVKLDRGIFDVMALSLITTGDRRCPRGSPRHPGRRRELSSQPARAAFPEDSWVGSVLSIGRMRRRVDQRDRRCVVVNVDPATAERDPATLRAIVRERQAQLGVYGSTVQPGRVAVGDPVVITAAASTRSCVTAIEDRV